MYEIGEDVSKAPAVTGLDASITIVAPVDALGLLVQRPADHQKADVTRCEPPDYENAEHEIAQFLPAAVFENLRKLVDVSQELSMS